MSTGLFQNFQVFFSEFDFFSYRVEQILSGKFDISDQVHPQNCNTVKDFIDKIAIFF